MKSLGSRYWFALISMTFGLGCTAFLVYTLRSDHGNQLWTSLGFGASGRTLNWCNNRVASVSIPNLKGTLAEENGKWVWKGSQEKSVNYLAVEKWFAKYCQININRVMIKDFTIPMSPRLEVQFVDGDSLTIFDLGENRIQINEHIFKSPQMQNGLKALKNILGLAN